MSHPIISNAQRLEQSIDKPLLAVWRSKFILFLILALFVSVFIRGLWIAGINNQFYSSQSKKRIEREITLHASRGKIYDRNQALLATSLPSKSLWLEPEDVDFSDKNWQKVSQILKINLKEIEKKSEKSKNYLFVKRQVEPDIAKKIMALKLKGMHTVSEPKRYYTQGAGLAQLLGFTNIEHQGQEGLELTLNQQLQGQNGAKKVLRDRFGNTIEQNPDKEFGVITPPKNGQDIYLTIDAHIQNQVYQSLVEAYQKHNAKLATAVVLDAQNGEVLAMANAPSFDPNQITQNQQRTGMRNYAVTDTFEVGSTIKPISIGIAMNQGKISENTNFNTNPFVVDGKTISDSHAAPSLNTLEIIQKSSNVGTVKITNLVSNFDMWQTYHDLGLGQVPKSLRFPGSASGRLRNYQNWKPIEKATMSYGYGVSASILQLAQAYTVFTNQGVFKPAKLLSNQNTTEKVVFNAKTAASLVKGLEMVTQAGGTAQKAQVLGYSSGGKTGTVHKQVGKGYDTNKYRAFFVGIAPIQNPKIIVAVMLDEPSNGEFYGGAVAAPIFSKIASTALRQLAIPLDQAITPEKNTQKTN
jgi:cell division protein FtsI (penicillin-binding protein 3)